MNIQSPKAIMAILACVCLWASAAKGEEDHSLHQSWATEFTRSNHFSHLQEQANKGVPDAMMQLGVGYMSGLLGTPDCDEAEKWLLRASRKHANGADDALNILKMARAANENNPADFQILAEMDLEAICGKYDPVEALKWISIDEIINKRNNAARIENIKANLNVQDIHEARRRATKWLASHQQSK